MLVNKNIDKSNNAINTKLQYIKINHKNKLEELEEEEYFKEIKNLTNTLQMNEQNIGFEINKFFQYILPENKEGDLLKVNIAISNKSKSNKKYIYQCIDDIMNMKEVSNLVLSKDFSEKLSTILKEIYRKIKKKSVIKTYNDLITKSKEWLHQGGNIIKKYTVEKKVNSEAINTDDSFIKKNSLINDKNKSDSKDFFKSTKSLSKLSKSFREQKALEFQFKEFKEDKKEILPAEMQLLIKKFSIIKKIKLTINDKDSNFKNKKNEAFQIDSNDIQNNILVLFNLDWLFQNLLELEVDLSNENLLKEQMDIQSNNLNILSDLLNKDLKLSISHSGIYKNIIYNPYQLSNFYSSSVQLKEEDYLYIQQNINNKIRLTFYSNYGKKIEDKYYALNQFIKNKKNFLEMIIIYGYFISKMESIHMCDFVLPMNLEEEIVLMLKMNKIFLTDFHFLSFFTSNQIFHFTINFNCLDSQSFEKVLSFISQNTALKICRINFFQSEEYFKPEILYKLLQNSNSNYKNLYNFKYDDANHYIYDLKINEELDDYLLRKLFEYFQKNLTNFFYLLTLRTNINELSLIFELPIILSKNDMYNIIIMKFLLNLFLFMDSDKNNLDTISVQAENFIFDSRKHTILNNFFDKLNLCNNPKNKIINMTYQVKFYKIINIYQLIPYNIEYLSLGSFDLETFDEFVDYITSSEFGVHSSLKKLHITLNKYLINYNECRINLIRLISDYPKNLSEINIYTNLVIKYSDLKELLLKSNYNTLENIFLQINEKSLNNEGYKDKYKSIKCYDNIIIEKNFLDLYKVIRKKKDSKKLVNVMNKLSAKINKYFLNYKIFQSIEKFIAKNDKKVNIIQFK